MSLINRGNNNNKRKLVLSSVEMDDEVEKQPRHVDAFYRFKVLLPNGMTISLRLPDEKSEMPLGQFLLLVKGEYFLARKQHHPVNWKSHQLYLQDANDNTIRHCIKLSNFKPNKCHILTLHNMWDLTPDPELLRNLPEEYSFDAALADLIDNSLQAVWFQRSRRLISVEIMKDKISIFDTGCGMDDSDENSIMKWGKMGASLHRSRKLQAIGGKPPYLRPFFGMFGYGGPMASMNLGRSTIVSSKTTDSKKVFTLHLERDALLNSTSKVTWRTNGGMRDPSEDEIRKSPQGSFTKVDVLDLGMKELNGRHIRSKLKDIYFPYIQCDEVSDTGKTSTPIEFKVNGVNLAEIQGGEVSITNLHSCNGPEFTFQLLFSANLHNAANKSPGLRASSKANARLKCLYFPISEGKENIERILEKLEVEGIGTTENYETFSRVSVRRLGRLLPDARWAFLPFTDLRQKKGEKAQILKRCCSRVKCFIETDGGFNPTPSKTDLAHHNPFTVALKNFGNKTIGRETEVNVEISRDGKVLTLLQLEKEYQEWIIQMHGLYDEEIACGEDEPVLVVGPSNKKKLGISSDVIRVHKILKRKGTSWKSGQRVKVLKGACAGVHNNNVFATLEYFLIEGFQGDAGGEARIICRPLGHADNDGCQITWNNGNASLNIRSSISLPISVIDSGKCQPIADSAWNLKLEKERQKAASVIDLLCSEHCKELDFEGGLPVDVLLHAGCSTPREIVAVFRPANYTDNTESLDQKYIVKTNFQMSMEVKYKRTDKDDPQHKYAARVSPSSHKGIGGLYIFQLGSKFPDLFKKSGIYSFSFISSDSSCEKYEKSIEVKGSSEVGKWELISNKRVKDYSVIVGSSLPPLSIACFDIFNNQIPFTSIPKVTVKLFTRNNIVLAQVDKVKATISSDRLTLQVKDLMIETSDLDKIRPNFEANLVISSENELVSLSIPCKVLPGFLHRVNARAPAQHLHPGSVVKELIFEMFDAHGNRVMKGLEVQLIADGLCFLDRINSNHKVDDNGCIDLSGVLKVTVDCGDVASVAVSIDDVEVFKQEYQIDITTPRTASKMMECGEVQSPHSDGKFLLHQNSSSLDHVGNLVLSIIDHDKVHDLEKDICRYGQRIADYENRLKLLDERKAEIEQSIYSLKACIQPVANNLSCLLTKGEVVEQIKDRSQSAAAILSYLSRDFSFKEPQKHLMAGILGVVAVLGTVSNSKLSRILSMYLGEDYMLAVVCTSYEAASALEKYDENGEVNLELGLHAEAAALGKCISDEFLVFCLEDMRPYVGMLDVSPQRKLLLPNPMLPSGEAPSGFIDYAVNMIELDVRQLDSRMATGNGLRETLFYRLFGQVQVYDTRNHMMAARSCIKCGAVSLDGGIIKEDGLFSLGYRNPAICFPVTTLDDGTPLSLQLIETQKQLQLYEAELMDIVASTESYTDAQGKTKKKFAKATDQYKRLMDKVDPVVKDFHNSTVNSSAIVPTNHPSYA